MKLVFLFVFMTIFALNFSAQAQDLEFLDLSNAQVVEPETQTEAGLSEFCLDCMAKKAPAKKAAKAIVKAVQRQYVAYRRSRYGSEIRPSCRMIIDQNGNYGEVGRALASTIQKRFAGPYLRSNSLRAFCPRFPDMSNEMKVKAWVWFWMVLANEESGCNPHIYHPTHYSDGRILNPKPGWGLWAAELLPQDRRWRGPMCWGNIKSATVQVNCAAQTMAVQLQRTNSVYWDGSYWGPVRRSRSQIEPNMALFRPCFESEARR